MPTDDFLCIYETYIEIEMSIIIIMKRSNDSDHDTNTPWFSSRNLLIILISINILLQKGEKFLFSLINKQIFMTILFDQWMNE